MLRERLSLLGSKKEWTGRAHKTAVRRQTDYHTWVFPACQARGRDTSCVSKRPVGTVFLFQGLYGRAALNDSQLTQRLTLRSEGALCARVVEVRGFNSRSCCPQIQGIKPQSDQLSWQRGPQRIGVAVLWPGRAPETREFYVRDQIGRWHKAWSLQGSHAHARRSLRVGREVEGDRLAQRKGTEGDVSRPLARPKEVGRQDLIEDVFARSGDQKLGAEIRSESSVSRNEHASQSNHTDRVARTD